MYTLFMSILSPCFPPFEVVRTGGEGSAHATSFWGHEYWDGIGLWCCVFLLRNICMWRARARCCNHKSCDIFCFSLKICQVIRLGVLWARLNHSDHRPFHACPYLSWPRKEYSGNKRGKDSWRKLGESSWKHVKSARNGSHTFSRATLKRMVSQLVQI